MNLHLKLVTVGVIGGIAISSLSGCGEPVPQDRWVIGGADMKQVKGFEDCFISEIKRTSIASPMVLVRCPNSTVTADYQVGKVRNETVVANDGPNQKMSGAIERIARLEQHIKEQDALIQNQRDSLRASLEILNVMKDAKQ